MYNQSHFEQRVVELLKLEKIELTPVPAEVGFHSVSQWQNAMELMREAYVKHHRVSQLLQASGASRSACCYQGAQYR